VNLKEIKEMIALMNENDLMELEIEKDGMRIKLKKSSGELPSTHQPIVIEQSALAAPQRNQIGPENAGQPQPSVTSVEIKAPMVGTFYRSPSPEAPPYVEVGQMVEPGQVICIIEAMKLMNEIKSEIRGKIVEITVDNAEPVEFGQTMLIIEPI
jgi:acetyl-CoA carboxylase biotin carboxyl carrier protein